MNFAYDQNNKILYAGGHGVGSDIHALAINPLDSNRLYAFSVDNGVFGTKDGIYKTTDEGKTFTQINSEIKNLAAITFDESNPKTLYAATSDGIVFRGIDGGKNWSKVNG